MTYSKHSHVICLSNVKQAALFFDRILPIEASDIYIMDPDIEVAAITSQGQKILKSLLSSPEDDLPNETISNVFVFTSELLYLSGRFNDETPCREDICASLTHAYLNKLRLPLSGGVCNTPTFAGEPVRKSVRRLADAVGLKKSSIMLQSDFLTDAASSVNDVSLTLMNIPLVDTSKASWDQILEFRRDMEARLKLRNLRLFLHTNYEGKSSAYIEDDLGKRLDDYHKACKDYGFETTTSVLSTVTNSKNLRVVGAASLAALILGEPIAASIAAITGASIEISNICIEIAKRRYGYNKLQRDHELAYIIEAQKGMKSS